MLVNGLINYAETGVAIDSGPVVGVSPKLTVSATTILNASKDGINAFDSPIHVDSSTIGDAAAGKPNIQAHGIIASFFSPANCPPSPAPPPSAACERVTLTGNHLYWIGNDGIVANGLGSQPTVVSDNFVNNAGAYGIRLVGADQLALNHNEVNNSGGPSAGFRYPAIYLSGVKADFELARGTGTVAENHGSGNGLNAMVMHGEANRSLTWLTTGVTAPAPGAPADHFGYLVDGGLTVDGALATNNGDLVKVLGGPITVNGPLTSTGTTFTSLKNALVGVAACDAAFDSAFVQKPSPSSACPPPASGDWDGINVSGPATLTNATISFDDGLTVGGALQFAGGAMRDIKKNAIVVSGSQVTVSKVAFQRIGQDAIDSTSSGSTDTITDNQFDQVGGVSINRQNEPADLGRNVFTNDAVPAIQTSSAAVTVACSSFQSGGLKGDGGLAVKESDFVPGVGVSANQNAITAPSAESNWWGQDTGPGTGQLSGLTVLTYLHTQRPTVAIAVTGKPSSTQPLDPVKSNGSLGTGLLEATLTFSRDMNQEPTAAPVVSYAGGAVSFSSGAWQTPRSWKATAPINSTLAATPSQTVSARDARNCVPDPAHNLMDPSPTTQPFTADTSGLPNGSVNGPADLIGATSARLHGGIEPNGWATGAQGHFVVTNTASPFDQHSYPTPVPAGEVTPVTFTVNATGLNPSSTYTYQLEVPSVNGTATQPTTDSVTTIGAASKVVVTGNPPASAVAGSNFSAAVP